MRILVSSSDIESCNQFKKYLIKYINKDLEVEILKNFYPRKIKNPNRLSLYYLNIYFMYSILCSRNFNSFIHKWTSWTLPATGKWVKWFDF